MSQRYALYASDEFNQRLHEALARLTADVQRALGDNLVALVLAGSYGRGEGAAVRINGVEYPYNDIDLVPVVKQKEAVPVEALAAIGNRYGVELKVEIDLGTPITTGDISKWPQFTPRYDLVHSHLVLVGPSDVISRHAPESLRGPLPPASASRTLLIPGLFLLSAMRVLRGVDSPPDSDFLRRAYYKCARALGDALLVVHQRYSPSYIGRDVRFKEIIKESPEAAALGLEALYRDALQFKFRPHEAPPVPTDEAAFQALAERWGQVFLHAERRRTARPWTSMNEYVGWKGLREPGEHTPAKLLRNLIRNRQLGVWSWRYPRERLYRQLPVLLGLAGSLPSDWPAQTAEFIATWKRFS